MPAGKQKLQYEVRVHSELLYTLTVFVSRLSNVFCFSLFLGYFYQGFQLPGLLQHEQRLCHSLGTKGERWKKEMSNVWRRSRFF